MTDAYDPDEVYEAEAVERATRLLQEAAALVDHDPEQLPFFRTYIENTEPELALGELSHFADDRPAPERFWRLLADAAALLNLTEEEPYYGSGVRIIDRHLRL